VFPVGIDVTEFERTLITTPVKERLNELYQRFKGKKVILGVDRLDYIKVPFFSLQLYETIVLCQRRLPSFSSLPGHTAQARGL
jgi:hypothetical protein